MVRPALALAVLLCCGSCALPGKTCGRGRCDRGSCVDVVTTFSQRTDFELDWWCAVPCEGDRLCPGALCLQSPIKSDLKVCAGNSLEVAYSYTGGEVPSPKGTTTLKSFTVSSPYVDGGTVECSAGTLCEAGVFPTGASLPKIEAVSSSGTSFDLSFRNGSPGGQDLAVAKAGAPGQLGPLLPTGVKVIIHLDGMNDQPF